MYHYRLRSRIISSFILSNIKKDMTSVRVPTDRQVDSNSVNESKNEAHRSWVVPVGLSVSKQELGSGAISK